MAMVSYRGHDLRIVEAKRKGFTVDELLRLEVDAGLDEADPQSAEAAPLDCPYAISPSVLWSVPLG